MTKKRKLPSLPSKLLTLAIDDLNRAERSGKYKVNMGIWHESRTHYVGNNEEVEKCEICLAGAVMAMTLGAPVDLDINGPDYYPNPIKKQLTALDHLRIGDVSQAFFVLGIGMGHGQAFDEEMQHYSWDRKGFKLDMRRLARKLKKAGF